MNESVAMTEEWVIVDPADADEVRRIAQENGVQAEEVEVRGIEPVLTVTFLLLGGAAAVATVLHMIEQHKGGQIIDLRADAPRLAYRTKDVVYGTVVIIANDGKVEVEVKEPRGLFGEVMDALKGIGVEVGKAGVAAVAEAAKKVVGDKGTVTPQPSPAA